MRKFIATIALALGLVMPAIASTQVVEAAGPNCIRSVVSKYTSQGRIEGYTATCTGNISGFKLSVSCVDIQYGAVKRYPPAVIAAAGRPATVWCPKGYKPSAFVITTF